MLRNFKSRAWAPLLLICLASPAFAQDIHVDPVPVSPGPVQMPNVSMPSLATPAMTAAPPPPPVAQPVEPTCKFHYEYVDKPDSSQPSGMRRDRILVCDQ
jgi:hypothetical protein